MSGYKAVPKVAEVPEVKSTSRSRADRDQQKASMLQFAKATSVMLLLLCFSAGAAASEALPSEYVFGRSAFPASNQGVAITVGDFNGDGRPDFVSANFSLTPSLTILVGQPNGGFLETQTIPLTAPANAGVAGDFNGDGTLDIAVVTSSGVSVLLGNGNGTFGTPTAFPINGVPVHVIAGDFNQDGHMDLAITVAANNISTGSPGVVAVLLGNGDGTFQSEIDSPAGTGVRDLVAGDFNGDRKLDVAVVNAPSFSSNTISLLIGKGDGTFKAAQNLTVAGEPTGIQVADFNKDGRLDLAVATGVTVAGPTGGDGLISILFGNGDGTFQPEMDVHAGGGIDSVVVTDLNHDGNQDIVADSQLAFNGSASVVLGNGNGTFQPHREYKYGGIFGQLFAGDFNGDGKMDIGVANGTNTFLVLLGNGGGLLAGSGSHATKHLPTAIISGDVNNDGIADVVAVNTTSTACPAPNSSVSVLLSRGDGGFQVQASYPTGDGPVGAAFGDFSGHGRLDLAVVNGCDNTVSILPNKGDGTYGGRVDYPTGNGPSSVVVGDFDRNGTTDLAITNTADNTVSILLGNGDGTFKPKVDYATGPGPTAIIAADLNGDGKLDLVTADSSTPQSFTDTGKVSLLLGNGNGTFQSDTELSLGQVLTPNDVVAADFNRDGKLDLAVVANRNAIGGVVVFTGNGNGTFLPPVQTFSTGRLSAQAKVADFDGDGTLDIAVTSFGQDRITLLKGNGDGTFATKGIYGATGFPLGIVAADFNLDNLPDIAFVNPSANTFATYLSIPPKGPDFNLTAFPPTATVLSANPATVNYTVSVGGRGGFNQTVVIGCSGAPRNATCAVSPSSVTVSGSTRQTVTVSVSRSSTTLPVPPGTYTLTVSGTSGVLQHDASLIYMSKR